MVCRWYFNVLKWFNADVLGFQIVLGYIHLETFGLLFKKMGDFFQSLWSH
jgi:hypothetical protein